MFRNRPRPSTVAALVFACATASSARADSVDQLRQFVGYTIVAVLPVVGYVDENGKRGDDFEGVNTDERSYSMVRRHSHVPGTAIRMRTDQRLSY
jgi:hypothetical protein